MAVSWETLERLEFEEKFGDEGEGWIDHPPPPARDSKPKPLLSHTSTLPPGASHFTAETDTDDLHPLFLPQTHPPTPSLSSSSSISPPRRRQHFIVHGYPEGSIPEWRRKPSRSGFLIPGSSFLRPLREQSKIIQTELRVTVFQNTFDSSAELRFQPPSSSSQQQQDDDRGISSDNEEDERNEEGMDTEDRAGSGAIPEALDPRLPFLLGNRRGAYSIRHPTDSVPIFLEYLQLLLHLPIWVLEKEFERFSASSSPSSNPQQLPPHPRRPPKLPGLSPAGTEALLHSFLRAAIEVIPNFAQHIFTQSHRLLKRRLDRAKSSYRARQKFRRKLLREQQQQQLSSEAQREGVGRRSQEGKVMMNPGPGGQEREEEEEGLVQEFAAFAYDLRDGKDLEIYGFVLRRFARDIPRLKEYLRSQLLRMQERIQPLSKKFFRLLDAGKDARITRTEFQEGWMDGISQLLFQEFQLNRLFPLHCFSSPDEENQKTRTKTGKLCFSRETSKDMSPFLLYLPFLDPRSQKFRREIEGR